MSLSYLNLLTFQTLKIRHKQSVENIFPHFSDFLILNYIYYRNYNNYIKYSNYGKETI